MMMGAKLDASKVRHDGEMISSFSKYALSICYDNVLKQWRTDSSAIRDLLSHYADYADSYHDQALPLEDRRHPIFQLSNLQTILSLSSRLWDVCLSTLAISVLCLYTQLRSYYMSRHHHDLRERLMKKIGEAMDIIVKRVKTSVRYNNGDALLKRVRFIASMVMGGLFDVYNHANLLHEYLPFLSKWDSKLDLINDDVSLKASVYRDIFQGCFKLANI